ncbi:hypothetical protein ACWT_2041 [Actinoplanes sp. SE50]|uniref:hypothetical protein n=1 Tax=unclassified Actinoplanes TaxID=2626549 RepID=UPI00023EC5AB|nr:MULTISPECIES: hypothetical protein [unclassified Actinoplanes]AEV83060.1 hypothetical protein ACPL_2163 [Actinoplanes sp. SE50/110]ATO81456.1 hypothetical protein ACWT_2041 [Actinoplanes sp. SE50]SLL98863.1 hypothetical protein ACSP50_2090 [Actinoplanes sp. SE50/110]
MILTAHPEITVDYEPTAAEVDAALRGNSERTRRQFLLSVVLLLAAGLGLIALGTTGSGALFVVLGVVSLLAGLFCVLLVAGIKQVRQRMAARLCVPTTVTLGAERYSYQMASGPGETRWEFTTVAISAACWTLAAANRIVLVIPKRALTEVQQAEFGAFLAGRDPKLVKTV